VTLIYYSDSMGIVETEDLKKGEWIHRCAKYLEINTRLNNELDDTKRRLALEIGRRDTIIFNLRERLKVLGDK
jgi:hypothetical protein